MSKYEITDEALYLHVPRIEKLELSMLPVEDSLTHQFSRKFLRKMRKLIAQSKQSVRQQRVIRFTKRSLLTAAIILALMFTLVMSVSALRAKFFEMISEIFQTHTRVTFQTEESALYEDSEYTELRPMKPTYLPEGYELQEDQTFGETVGLIYSDESNHLIVYLQTPIAIYASNIDTENVNQKHSVINGVDYWIIEKEGDYSVVWTDDTQVYEILFGASPLATEEEIIKIAQSVK